MVLILEETTFDKEVLQHEGLSVVDLWAPWCGPCRSLSPVIEELAIELKDKVKIAKVNIDNNPTLTTKFGITSIPTVLFFKGGQIIHKQVGAISKSKLLQIINEFS